MTAFETPQFRAAFDDLLAWRRDVRRFRADPLPEALIDDLIGSAALAPSVGLSQPWRFACIRSAKARETVRANFERCNAEALAGYDGPDAELYASLKLEGLATAPEQLAVFADHATVSGRGLGRRTMPQTLDYSVVTAIHALWLKARTHGVGVGWVSILDPDRFSREFALPPAWKFIAYLCIGYPAQASETPELQQLGWETRRAQAHPVLEL